MLERFKSIVTSAKFLPILSAVIALITPIATASYLVGGALQKITDRDTRHMEVFAEHDRRLALLEAQADEGERFTQSEGDSLKRDHRVDVDLLRDEMRKCQKETREDISNLRVAVNSLSSSMSNITGKLGEILKGQERIWRTVELHIFQASLHDANPPPFPSTLLKDQEEN